MNTLSETLRELMERHELTGAKLAEEIGVSAVSLSHILTGKSRPRQVTLSRLMKRLCENAEDEQVLLSAYESLGAAKMPVSAVVEDGENAATEEERVRRFMDMKAKSISFRKDVAHRLHSMRLHFQQEYTKGSVTTDFLIEHGRKRIALECRADAKRDLEKSLVSARIIRDELKCDRVFIVVPKLDNALKKACASENAIMSITLRDLPQHLATRV